MEVRSITRFARVSARKARLIVDQIRGKRVEEAVNIVQFLPQKAAEVVKKTLNSALANAQKKEGVNLDSLFVLRTFVDDGPAMKRFQPRAMGRASMIKKKMSHITIILSDGVAETQADEQGQVKAPEKKENIKK